MVSNAATRWTQPTAVLSTVLALYLGYKALRLLDNQRRQRAIGPSPTSPVLVNHFQFVKVNGKQLRIVHIPHALGSKVPLLVFIHGVGGQLEQFEKQIEYFSHSTHILAIDQSGYGASDVPESFDYYTTGAYVEDVVSLLQRYKSEDTVVICHSYGCTIGTLLYSRLVASETLNNSIKAMVMIGPKAVITEHEAKGRAQLAKTPDWVVDFARKLDRMGGTHSKSVNRLLHASASDDLRRKQLRWNKASRTFVLRRLMAGVQWPTPGDFQMIQCPLLLMSGEDDRVCPAVNAEQIYAWCRGTNDRIQSPFIIDNAGHMPMLEKWEHVTPIISSFLIKDCGMTTMDPAWQITKKCEEENIWSLKNTEKWMNTPIISAPVGKGPGKFRAMKVLRQTDRDHSPSAFLAKHPEVGFIVDISSKEPSYRTTDFEATSITYTKLPTVSKIPPSKEDVDRFIDHCNACWEVKPGVEIAVHCHYGFNRTGFMLCSYLIQEQGYSVAEALHSFENARPPRGIRHDHFKGELYLRYEPPKRFMA
ncbi:hypothetical protein BGZ96_003066 [Linnemannia gamsii]|uniref:Tyrosine specific protein phosphatases domain-containing protein n=1 Tax=Linnemannia gamsii TaxID=64522 RepID=A0ABQ7JK61_9FUNG|nr:hypothetical protein BGZ96_003066 [Linnemannia gamsii]